jgi:hypothetical protein
MNADFLAFLDQRGCIPRRPHRVSHKNEGFLWLWITAAVLVMLVGILAPVLSLCRMVVQY